MMKSYKKMADEVLEAVNEYNSKRVRRNIQLRIVAPAACCCLAAATALGAWGSGLFNGIPSSEVVESRTNTETETGTETGTGEEFAFETDPITEETSGELPAFTMDTSEGNMGTDICLPLPSESSDTDINPAVTDDMPYTEDITTEPPETSPIQSGHPNIPSPYEYVENAHAPLDGYEFTLPITPKNTDIILALLNAYEIPDGSGDVINTTYELDIGLYLEAGYSNVRTYVPAEKGSEVYALQDGKVVYADWTSDLGYNMWVANSDQTYIVYYHLDSFAVNEGDIVSKDQVIGYVGDTGMVAGTPASYMRRDTVTNTVWEHWYRDEHIDGQHHGSESHHVNTLNSTSGAPVWIPDMNMDPDGFSGEIPANEDFFVHLGNVYVKYGEADAEILDGYMGTATGKIERATTGEYLNFSGTAAGDMYSIKYYDSNNFIGIKRGDKADIYFNNNGITLRYGGELIKIMLKMYDYDDYDEYGYKSMEYTDIASGNVSVYSAEDTAVKEKVDQFLDKLCYYSSFVYFDDIGETEPIGKLCLTMDHGLKFGFEIYEGGVRFDGLESVCLEKTFWRYKI